MSSPQLRFPNSVRATSHQHRRSKRSSSLSQMRPSSIKMSRPHRTVLIKTKSRQCIIRVRLILGGCLYTISSRMLQRRRIRLYRVSISQRQISLGSRRLKHSKRTRSRVLDPRAYRQSLLADSNHLKRSLTGIEA